MSRSPNAGRQSTPQDVAGRPDRDPGIEADAYDRDDTIYLMVEDAATGRHLGSVRLLSTTGPHLLADRFAALCEAGVPHADDIMEISRMVTRPGLPRDAAEQVREQLAVALVEFGLARGLSAFTMMTPMDALPTVIAAGWDCRPLGLPQAADGVTIAALRITFDAAILQRMRGQFRFVEPVLRLDLSGSALAA
jgi:N-acyl-L-homoserine lactone synthetase